MRVEFHPGAEAEFNEEAAYYEQQVSTLGHSFVAELETAVALLQKHPGLGVVLENPYRHLPMRRFPHSLIYVVETSQIQVLAGAHQKRRPGYWRARIDR